MAAVVEVFLVTWPQSTPPRGIGRNGRREPWEGVSTKPRHFQEHEGMATLQATDNGGQHNQVSLFSIHFPGYIQKRNSKVSCWLAIEIHV